MHAAAGLRARRREYLRQNTPPKVSLFGHVRMHQFQWGVGVLHVFLGTDPDWDSDWGSHPIRADLFRGPRRAEIVRVGDGEGAPVGGRPALRCQRIP